MINIFSKDRKKLKTDTDTWIVKWTTYKQDGFCSVRYPKVIECYMAFTDKAEAEEYTNVLNGSMRLLGITSLPDATFYKQRVDSI